MNTRCVKVSVSSHQVTYWPTTSGRHRFIHCTYSGQLSPSHWNLIQILRVQGLQSKPPRQLPMNVSDVLYMWSANTGPSTCPPCQTHPLKPIRPYPTAKRGHRTFKSSFIYAPSHSRSVYPRRLQLVDRRRRGPHRGMGAL